MKDREKWVSASIWIIACHMICFPATQAGCYWVLPAWKMADHPFCIATISAVFQAPVIFELTRSRSSSNWSPKMWFTPKSRCWFALAALFMNRINGWMKTSYSTSIEEHSACRETVCLALKQTRWWFKMVKTKYGVVQNLGTMYNPNIYPVITQ